MTLSVIYPTKPPVQFSGSTSLFRFNGYRVVEGGIYEDLFHSLKSKRFDYVTLGSNEIEDAFERRCLPLEDLCIESNILIRYDFPLVFYVNPDRQEFAKRLNTGLNTIHANGQFDSLFDNHYSDLLTRLNLKKRRCFDLENPNLSH